MMLVSDWKRVLRHAWSVRLMLLAALLTGCETILPLVQDIIPIPQWVFAGLSFVAVSGGFAMRLLAQKEFTDADQ
jgi:hypothetical protein